MMILKEKIGINFCLISIEKKITKKERKSKKSKNREISSQTLFRREKSIWRWKVESIFWPKSKRKLKIKNYSKSSKKWKKSKN